MIFFKKNTKNQKKEIQKDLYLHIGMNKTGTTAIQKYCSLNSNLLAKYKIIYPVTGQINHVHYGLANSLGFDLQKETLPDDELNKIRLSLIDEVNKSCARVCIISSENFIRPNDVNKVKNFLHGFNCKVVVYLRRHDHWWASAYAQAIKTKSLPPWQPGIRSFIKFNINKDPSRANYRVLVDRWAEVFGVENIIVRPYESAQNPGGVVADFFSSIGQHELANVTAESADRVNESLHPSALHVIDILQRIDMDPGARSDFLTMIVKDDWGPRTGDIMPPTLRSRLVKENKADYAYIAQKYMGRENGKLFLEPLPDPDANWLKPATPDSVEVVSRLMKYWSLMKKT